MSPTRLEQWEDRLDDVLEAVDHELEKRYGDRYPLRPNRPEHGATANPAYDGLFTVIAKYSLGLGSEHGEGYVVEVRISTLTRVPDDVEETIRDEAVDLLRAKLPAAFPDRTVEVKRDGTLYKICGDLSF